MCQDRQGFTMSRKASVCIWIGSPIRLSHWTWRFLPHLHWNGVVGGGGGKGGGGIHSLFVRWRSNFHAVLGSRFMPLSLTRTESRTDMWEDQSTFLRQLLALSALFFACTWLWLSKAVAFTKQIKSVLWIQNIQILPTSSSGITSRPFHDQLSRIQTDGFHI